MLFFQNMPINSIISKFAFLRRHHFRTLSVTCVVSQMDAYEIVKHIYWYTRHYKDDSMRCGGKKKQWKSAVKLVGRQSNGERRFTKRLMGNNASKIC